MERLLARELNVRACALLGAAMIAFSSIFVRLSHASPSTAAIFRCAYALPLLGLLALLEDRRLGRRPWRDRRSALLSGVFFAADLIMWHHAIGDVGAGLATVLANVQVVLLPLAAWLLLAEAPSRRVLLALPAALAGVLLISGALQHGAYGRDPGRGALFGLGAGVAYVGFLLLLRRGGRESRRRPPGPPPAAPAAAGAPIHPAAGPLFDATLVAALVALGAGVVIGDARLVPSWPGAGWLLLLAVSSQVVGWMFITVSLPRLPASLTSLLLLVQPIGSVILGAIIFGEAPDALQLLGVAAVLGALLYASAPRASAKQILRALSDQRRRPRPVAGEQVPPGA